MTVLRESAFAKVNLCLFVGAARDDGRHELVTVFESVELTDSLVIEAPSPTGRDEVVCPGVKGPNLVAHALASLRAAGWEAPRVRVEIVKRIPVSAGMGGGSADAAALLRSAPELAPIEPDALYTIAAALGSDVPSQLDPGPALGTGAGDLVSRLPQLAEHALVVVPQPFWLSTRAVYREADRLGLGRPAAELDALGGEIRASLTEGARLPARLLVNDLEAAARWLRPELDGALDAVRAASGDSALVCGSGPTVISVCWGPDSLARTAEACDQLRDRFPEAVAVRPVHRGVGVPAANP